MVHGNSHARHTEPMAEARGITGWFMAAALAVIAVAAVALTLTLGARTPGQDQIAQLQDQGRVAGLVEAPRPAARLAQ